jgi:signal peptidase I
MAEQETRGWLPEWIVNIIVLLFGITMVAQPNVIPTSSMENNLLVGDHVIVDKMAYSTPGSISRRLLPYAPVRRGDIIVFRFPLNVREYYVKRVIGVPGDRIRIAAKQVYVNGKPLAEPYKVHKTEWVEDYRDNFPAPPLGPVDQRGLDMLREHTAAGELVVPPDNYFAMGDNRDNSLDSRYWGFVPRENIVGKPVLIWWSYDAPTDRLQDGNPRLDHLADLALHFFTKTRWSRTFQIVHSYRHE